MGLNGGAQIGNYHTYDDLHMIPKSKLFVAPPEVKTVTFSIPGADGEIDLTSAIMGTPAYTNRKGSWDFLVVTGENYMQAYTNCLGAFNGEVKDIVLDDQPSVTYTGRVWVNQWKSYEGFGQITLDYNIEVE